MKIKTAINFPVAGQVPEQGCDLLTGSITEYINRVRVKLNVTLAWQIHLILL
jgi:hypothetical protein